MLLTYPKTFVILKQPYKVDGVDYVVMDLEGVHFTHREYRKICQSPYATFITEDLYIYNMTLNDQQQDEPYHDYEWQNLPSQQQQQYYQYDMSNNYRVADDYQV